MHVKLRGAPVRHDTRGAAGSALLLRRARACPASSNRARQAQAALETPPDSRTSTGLVSRRGVLNLAACSCCVAALQLAPQRALANQSWAYGAPGGVSAWPNVSKTCAAGTAQSPVDLVTATATAAATNTCVSQGLCCKMPAPAQLRRLSNGAAQA